LSRQIKARQFYNIAINLPAPHTEDAKYAKTKMISVVRFDAVRAVTINTICLLRCKANKSSREVPMFQRILLPPTSGQKSGKMDAARFSKTLVTTDQTARSH
jgi:hypothetical protein